MPTTAKASARLFELLDAWVVRHYDVVEYAGTPLRLLTNSLDVE